MRGFFSFSVRNFEFLFCQNKSKANLESSGVADDVVEKTHVIVLLFIFFVGVCFSRFSFVFFWESRGFFSENQTDSIPRIS